MHAARATCDAAKFNPAAELPFNLRTQDFQMAMQDVYDFFFDVNRLLIGKGLQRLDDMLRPAIMSGLLSDMVTSSLARHSRSLTVNAYHNGHPDLLVRGRYPDDATKSGTEGVEIKTTRKPGGSVDMHGAREQWLAVFVYEIDSVTQPATDRQPLCFREIYLKHVTVDDFRKNERGELGTRTASLDKGGLQRLRSNWVYLDR